MSPRQQGMTLVEVMVAVMVLSMIMLGLITAMRTFANSYVALDAISQRTSSLREVNTFLRHSLRTAVFPTPDSFELGEGDLKWRAPLDRVGSAGGVLWLRLRQEGDELVLHFALPEQIASDIEPVEPRWDEDVAAEVLMTGIEGLEISAKWDETMQWGARAGGAAAGLPRLLRVQVDFADGRPWPALVVSLDGYSEARG